MIIALISVVLAIILMLIAIRIGLNRSRNNEEEAAPQIIHASGIYSIVKKSPREDITAHRPRKEDIQKYISGINEDIDGQLLSSGDKERLVTLWETSIDENIGTIEKGDIEGVEFYYYDFVPAECPVCKRYFSKGKFVTREEIYRFPSIIPPLHLGCTCKLMPHHGKENLRETTELGLLPLFRNQAPPRLPEWNITTKTYVE